MVEHAIRPPGTRKLRDVNLQTELTMFRQSKV